jgi:hypothetical protein
MSNYWGVFSHDPSSGGAPKFRGGFDPLELLPVFALGGGLILIIILVVTQFGDSPTRPAAKKPAAPTTRAPSTAGPPTASTTSDTAPTSADASLGLPGSVANGSNAPAGGTTAPNMTGGTATAPSSAGGTTTAPKSGPTTTTGPSTSTSATTKPTKPEKKKLVLDLLKPVAASALQKDYLANATKANDQFKGKRFQVYGVVRTVETDKNGRLMVVLGGGTDNPLNTVNCHLMKIGRMRDGTDDVSKIVPLQLVMMEGTCQGKNQFVIDLEDSRFVRFLDPKELK